MTFNAKLVPPQVHKIRSLEDAFPWLYRKGISTGVNFKDGIEQTESNQTIPL